MLYQVCIQCIYLIIIGSVFIENGDEKVVVFAPIVRPYRQHTHTNKAGPSIRRQRETNMMMMMTYKIES